MKKYNLGLFLLLFLFSLLSLSCSSGEIKPKINAQTELGKLVYHELPGFYIENFAENQEFAQSLYVNQKKHLFLTIRAQKSYYDFQRKLGEEYSEKHRITLAGHSLHEGINQTDANISYLLVFKKGDLIYEVHIRTPLGYFHPLSEIKKLAKKIVVKILKS